MYRLLITMPPSLRITYTSEDFVAGSPVTNGRSDLKTNWNDLLWAAITVGRPNRQYVFKHGRASLYEALFRLSLVRMALEQSGPHAFRLRRTDAAKTLDPSEKSAVNYFLGLAVCKLFADKVLNVPWMLHLDVFRPHLNAVLKGRSRPDLIGQNENKDWIVMECKGRASLPDADAKRRVKEQAQRVVTVKGVPPVLAVGGIMHFRNDVLEFFWRDPPQNPERVVHPINVEIQGNRQPWAVYYQPVLDLLRADARSFGRMTRRSDLVRFEELDVSIGVEPTVFRLLESGQWDEARSTAERLAVEPGEITYQRDGIRVVAGETWLRPFDDEGGERIPVTGHLL